MLVGILAVAFMLPAHKIKAAEKDIEWQKFGSAAADEGKFLDVALRGNSVYAVGTKRKNFGFIIPSWDDAWRVERRNRADGNALSTIFNFTGVTITGSEPRGKATGAVADSSGVYIVGYEKVSIFGITTYTWKIVKYPLTGGKPIWSKNSQSGGGLFSFSLKPSSPDAVALDETGLYVAGHSSTDIFFNWVTSSYVEKWSPGGMRLWWKQYDPSIFGFGVHAIPTAISVSNGKVYVGGYYLNDSSNVAQSFIESRYASGDDAGEVIINKKNDLGKNNNGHVEGLAVQNGFLYSAGSNFDFANSESNRWIVQKRDLDSLEKIGLEIDADYASNYESLNDIAANPSGLYLVGKVKSGTNSDWRIEKRSLEDLSPSPAGPIWEDNVDFPLNPVLVNDEAISVEVDRTEIYTAGYQDDKYFRIDLRGNIFDCGIEFSSVVAIPPASLSENSVDNSFFLKETDMSSYIFCDCPRFIINKMSGSDGVVSFSPVNPISAGLEPFDLNQQLTISTGTISNCPHEDFLFQGVGDPGDLNCANYAPTGDLNIRVVKSCGISCSPVDQTVYAEQTARIRATSSAPASPLSWTIISGDTFPNDYVDSFICSEPDKKECELKVNPDIYNKNITVQVENCCGSATCDVHVGRAGWIETNQ